MQTLFWNETLCWDCVEIFNFLLPLLFYLLLSTSDDIINNSFWFGNDARRLVTGPGWDLYARIWTSTFHFDFIYCCLLLIILQSPQLLDSLGCAGTLFTIVLCRQSFGAKPGCMCFDTVINALNRANLHCLQPESLRSHNSVIHWCATFQP